MRRILRPLLLLVAVSIVAASVMPAHAVSDLSVVWERNWGTYNGIAPYAAGEFDHPIDVATDKWGNVYVAGGVNGDNRIQMFDADGGYITAYDDGGPSAGQLAGPYAVATDRWGNIYVGQYLNERIEVFGPGLWTHARSIDVPFAGNSITGLAVGLDGTIFNVRYRTDLQVRDRQGTLIVPALTPPDPIGVGVSQDGEIYAALDAPSNMVGVYNPDLTLKWAWGTTGTGPGYYDRPWEAVIDGGGNVFVSEFENARVQVLSPNSEVLAVFGNTGTASQLLGSPAGIAAGLDRTVYVCDYDQSRISKWKVSTAATVAEIEGDTRYTTAVAASEKAYPDPDTVDIVVLATGANWPDALGGAALAGTVKGPLLLTTKDTLPTAVADEITRLAPKRVYVLGGSDVVSNAVMNAAKALTTMDIATRLEGPTRYETAIAIAAEVKAMRGVEYDGTAFVCTGENFPDALAVSPIAARFS